MAWKMIGQPKTRRLTKGLATEFAEMQAAPHDRPLNATRCAVLKAAFDLGKFRTCEWASAYCEQTKQKYRINGKHTSTVLSTMNGVFPADLSVIVEEYHCETMEDVAALYATFDTRSQVRTTGDINMIYSACCPELDGCHHLDINLAVTGMAYGMWEDHGRNKPVEERAKLSVQHPKFVLWLRELLSGAGSVNWKHLRRAAVVGAMFRTYNKSKEAATEFWKAVRDETGPKPDLPDRKLAKYLMGTRLMSKNRSLAKPATNREQFVKCLHAWNAWRTKQPTGLIYHPNAKTPAVK